MRWVTPWLEVAGVFVGGAPLGVAYSGSQRPTAQPQPVPAGER
jgi:hypothetical protein